MVESQTYSCIKSSQINVRKYENNCFYYNKVEVQQGKVAIYRIINLLKKLYKHKNNLLPNIK